MELFCVNKVKLVLWLCDFICDKYCTQKCESKNGSSILTDEVESMMRVESWELGVRDYLWKRRCNPNRILELLNSWNLEEDLRVFWRCCEDWCEENGWEWVGIYRWRGWEMVECDWLKMVGEDWRWKRWLEVEKMIGGGKDDWRWKRWLVEKVIGRKGDW